MPPRERLGDNVALLFRELIHERTGLTFDNSRGDVLAEKLEALVETRGLESYLDYYYVLKDDAKGLEWSLLLDAFSVRETYFWREMAQVQAVVKHVVPRLVEELKGFPLRIWSVPCSTGEEPLTLAMALDEAGWLGRARIEIHASDGSPAAVAHARRGLYRERAFRSLPESLRDRYFTPDGDAWRVDARLQGRVRWSVVNLVAPREAEMLAGSPIVFCRNLFIYFSEASIRRVVEHFAARMPRGGVLCLGVSESILKITDAFDLQEIDGAFVYVKT